ncbi:type II toxin-antitoxin system PemK/MazF family toxin [Glutamicibacter protophormiae]|uniref:Type II toxin-antitoxin system PemK/MazF family toxin n=1 Tax=Glutamicibacter protophormiae TaxID=37930 RepID=A0ABS4XT36_GLUPR|nr:type II toxin-antitoxin system PemK/MazF family toxin [Glutamicibacter protophormiae]MBP2399669.1 hypothetical protein [Glutamicibacter protophormiae]GGL88225.1 hypothetical protein GCM10010038_17820 [Glutamicibacter protophormiae]
MALNAQKIFDFILRAVKELGSSSTKSTNAGGAKPQPGGVADSRRPASGGNRSAGASPRPAPAAGSRSGYPGDFTGTIRYEYNPSMDGDADPGEVVWGWVPFEKDYSQGKDRPVLVIGRDDGWLLGLMLTSKDKNNSQHHNPNYLDIGTGAWDRERRPSEVKLDRIIRLSQDSVRREGAILDEDRFRNVVKVLNNRR